MKAEIIEDIGNRVIITSDMGSKMEKEVIKIRGAGVGHSDDSY